MKTVRGPQEGQPPGAGVGSPQAGDHPSWAYPDLLVLDRRLACLRGDPHCFDCKFSSSASIALLFDVFSGDTMISEPMVAFRKRPSGVVKN